MLDDLGSPADIVAAAAPQDETGAPPPQVSTSAVAVGAAASQWGALEILAVFSLTVGAFVVPILAPIVGLALAWASARWSRREKIVGEPPDGPTVGGAGARRGRVHRQRSLPPRFRFAKLTTQQWRLPMNLGSVEILVLLIGAISLLGPRSCRGLPGHAVEPETRCHRQVVGVSTAIGMARPDFFR